MKVAFGLLYAIIMLFSTRFSYLSYYYCSIIDYATGEIPCPTHF